MGYPNELQHYLVTIFNEFIQEASIIIFGF